MNFRPQYDSLSAIHLIRLCPAVVFGPLQNHITDADASMLASCDCAFVSGIIIFDGFFARGIAYDVRAVCRQSGCRVLISV